MTFSIFLIIYDRCDSLSHPKALPYAISSLNKLISDFDLILVNNKVF